MRAWQAPEAWTKGESVAVLDGKAALADQGWQVDTLLPEVLVKMNIEPGQMATLEQAAVITAIGGHRRK